MSRSPNTPGFLGYLAALGTGGLVFGLLCALTGFETGLLTPVFGVLVLLYLSLFTLGLPVVVLIAFALVVHVGVRPFQDQRVHVLTAFAAPFLGVLPFVVLSGFAHEAVLVLLTLPVSMAIGRAAVIPLVRRPA